MGLSQKIRLMEKEPTLITLIGKLYQVILAAHRPFKGPQ